MPRLSLMLPCLLCLCVACAGPPPPDPVVVAPARDPVLLVPVPAKAQEGSSRYQADWSFDIWARPHASVHVHVIPPGQMVPLHRHPENWELTFIAAGQAHWRAVAAEGGAAVASDHLLDAGQAAVAPPGAAHQVRNLGPELLAAVVVHQPEFGQNWYLPLDEVDSVIRSAPLGVEVEAPAGWSVGWEPVDAGPAQLAEDHVILVAEGQGTLSFEDKRLPLSPGDVAVVPAGLAHTLADGDGLRLLGLRVPRPPTVRNP